MRGAWASLGYESARSWKRHTCRGWPSAGLLQSAPGPRPLSAFLPPTEFPQAAQSSAERVAYALGALYRLRQSALTESMLRSRYVMAGRPTRALSQMGTVADRMTALRRESAGKAAVPALQQSASRSRLAQPPLAASRGGRYFDPSSSNPLT
jgi:hypothetical protein